MGFKEDIDLLLRQNETLVQTLSLMGTRLDTSLHQLSAISALTAVPLKATSLKAAGSMILEILLRELSDIHACSLLLHRPESDMLTLYAARGQGDLLQDTTEKHHGELAFRIGEGVAGQVFVRNEPIFWERNSPEPSPFKISPEMNTPESLACLPLSLFGNPIGILNVSFGTIRPFDHPRKRDLIILCGVIANIIQTFILRDHIPDGARPWSGENTAFSHEHPHVSPEEEHADLKEKHRMLEQVVNNGPGIVFLWRNENGWPVEFVSENVRRLGYSSKEFGDAGIRYDTLIHPEDLERVVAAVRSHSEHEQDILQLDYRLQAADGGYRLVHERSMGKRNEDGQITHYYGMIVCQP